jgi:hypothetical protein
LHGQEPVAFDAMKLRSKSDACTHPATGVDIPPAGAKFEVDAATGAALVAAGLAEVAAEPEE